MNARTLRNVKIGAKWVARQDAPRFLRAFRNPLITLSAASVAVTLLLVGSGIWWLHALAISNAARELTNLSIVITELLDTTVQSADIALRDAQTEVQIAGLGSPDARFRLHRLFKDDVRNLPQLRTISVVDAHGALKVTSREFPAVEHNVADRDYFLGLKERPASGRSYVGFPVNSETTGVRTFSISQAILDEGGSFKGIIRVGMETSYFEDLFARIKIGNGSAITLIRADGIVLLRAPVDQARAGRDISRTSKFLLEGDPEPVWHRSPLDGAWRLVSARKCVTHR